MRLLRRRASAQAASSAIFLAGDSIAPRARQAARRLRRITAHRLRTLRGSASVRCLCTRSLRIIHAQTPPSLLLWTGGCKRSCCVTLAWRRGSGGASYRLSRRRGGGENKAGMALVVRRRRADRYRKYAAISRRSANLAYRGRRRRRRAPAIIVNIGCPLSYRRGASAARRRCGSAVEKRQQKLRLLQQQSWQH